MVPRWVKDAIEDEKVNFVTHDVEDFQPLGIHILDNIAQKTREANSAGKRIYIFCGHGEGRTGTAVSAAVLGLIESNYLDANEDYQVCQPAWSHYNDHPVELMVPAAVSDAVSRARIQGLDSYVETI